MREMCYLLFSLTPCFARANLWHKVAGGEECKTYNICEDIKINRVLNFSESAINI